MHNGISFHSKNPSTEGPLTTAKNSLQRLIRDQCRQVSGKSFPENRQRFSRIEPELRDSISRVQSGDPDMDRKLESAIYLAQNVNQDSSTHNNRNS